MAALQTRLPRTLTRVLLALLAFPPLLRRRRAALLPLRRLSGSGVGPLPPLSSVGLL
jgi:hypothetical protein